MKKKKKIESENKASMDVYTDLLFFYFLKFHFTIIISEKLFIVIINNRL